MYVLSFHCQCQPRHWGELQVQNDELDEPAQNNEQALQNGRSAQECPKTGSRQVTNSETEKPEKNIQIME